MHLELSTILTWKPKNKHCWLFRLIFHLSFCICRCESCHGQAEKLLDSAKEMEDSIAVNLRSGWLGLMFLICLYDVQFPQYFYLLLFISSRRLEVSRVELLLQVGTFCVGVGALVAGMPFTCIKSIVDLFSNCDATCIAFCFVHSCHIICPPRNLPCLLITVMIAFPWCRVL